MNRAFQIISLALLMLLPVITAGCGKNDESTSRETDEGGAAVTKKLGPAEVKRILDENLPVLNDDLAENRIKAARALGELGGQGRKAVRPLLDRLAIAEEDSEIKAVKEALVKVAAADTPLIVERMINTLDSVTAYKKERDEFEEIIAQHDEELKKKDDEINEIILEKGKIAGEKKELNDILFQTRELLKNADGKIEDMKSAVVDAEEKLRAADARIVKLNNEIVGLTTRVARCEAAEGITTGENKELKEKLIKAQEAYRAKSEHIKQLEQKITQLEEKINELQG